MFQCSRCGECCRHLDLSPLYRELDRGDGTCIYLASNLCSIYESRPLICRVDESYWAFFAKTLTKEAYYELNHRFCEELKKSCKER